MSEPRVAIVGATGAVGQEFLTVLAKRSFPMSEVVLLASARSAGKTVSFQGKELVVRELTEQSFKDVDIALFSAGGSITKQYAKAAVDAGCVIVDNSSAYRMDPETPLVIPEINPEDAKNHKGIIANPNCSTIIMLMALYPIHKINPIRNIVVSTYQAASGAGAAAMEELRTQSHAVLAGDPFTPQAFPYQIAFNAFSHNAEMDLENGYNLEEIKMVREAHKILHTTEIPVSPTCIRIGTFRAHAESIHVELAEPADLDAIRIALDEFPGVRLVDDRARNYFPMPIEASGEDDVLVGRLRRVLSRKDGKAIELFCCGDQLLKGAALNAVQIAELLV